MTAEIGYLPNTKTAYYVLYLQYGNSNVQANRYITLV